MRVVTLNVNGVRSAARKGLYEWLALIDADIVCLQEVRAQAEHLEDPLFNPPGYFCYYVGAQKKGYSGVAVYTKQKPLAVQTSLGFAIADDEGRYVQLDFENFSVASLYFPSGSSSEERQAVKYLFLDALMPYLQTLRANSREYILCGDWNIAHKPVDLKNWRSNQKNSGFLPQERAWLDTLFDTMGFVDAFRVVDTRAEQYTWWSNRGAAWDKNVGWRIDYQIVTPGLKSFITAADIYKTQRFSDHAPLVMDYAL